MTIVWSDWVIPAVSAAAVGVWLLNLRMAFDRIQAGIFAADLRIATLATVAVASVALLVSSLVYPGIIAAEGSRIGVTTARLALLIGGLAVWWMARKEEA